MDTSIAEKSRLTLLPLQPLKGEHPMLDIPFVVGIDGRQFRGERLSLVMAEITGLMDPHLDGATRLMRFQFPFNGFSVTLDVQGQVQSVDRAKGSAMVSFVDPAGDHLPQLRHLLNSYIAGDLVALGEVISVGSTLPSPAARAASIAGAKSRTFGRILGTAGMALATLLLVAGVGSLAYKRIFTLPLTSPGLAAQDGITLAAVASGQVDYLNLDAAKGEVAFTIRSSAGELLSIAMPCDCAASALGAAEGATVQTGQPMLNVHTADAPIVITTEVSQDQLLELAFADHVAMVFGDGATLRATVDPQSLRGQSGSATQLVRLIPDVPLDPALAGQMARLTVIKKLPFSLALPNTPL